MRQLVECCILIAARVLDLICRRTPALVGPVLALAIFGVLLVPVDLHNVASLSDSLTGVAVQGDARQEILDHAALIVTLQLVDTLR